MDTVTIEDKTFNVYMQEDEIQSDVKKVASEINERYKGKKPLFLGILNGAFMFAADLLKNIDLDCQISFVKVSSYSGTKSTEHINQLIGFDIPLTGRDIIITEDIIDTGLTIEYVLRQLKNMNVASVAVATLLFKPASFKGTYKIDFIGKSIPNDFIIGYGFDYNGYGRNYKNIYQLKTQLTAFALTGAPGAGKGTQAEILRQKYNIGYISTGDALRSEIAAGTELGKQVSGLINNGQLVPDDVVLSIIVNFMKKAKESGVESVLLDGFPRTLRQAEMLDGVLKKEDVPFVGMINIVVDEQVLADRISKRAEKDHRADDDLETLKKRLDEYHTKTVPSVEYYRRQNKLYEVNGVGAIEDINKEICKIVDEII